MEVFISLGGIAVAFITLVVAVAQFRRTPKLEAEPKITPSCLTIIGVPMNHGRDRLGL